MANLDDLLKVVQRDKKKILSKEEEVKLGEIIQSPTSTEISKQKAIEDLVLCNIRLVLKICHGYKRKEFEFEDLVNYGILGLYKAAQKFDPLRKNRFASYARHWIKEAIMKAIREYSGIPKIPVYLVKNLWCVTRILAADDTISDDDLAKRADISEKDAAYLRSLIFKVVQFDTAYIKGSPETPEAIYALKERNELIHKILRETLTKNEFIVLAHVYELCGHTKMTLERIENELYIKNPSSIKAKAVKKLRNSTIIQELYKEG